MATPKTAYTRWLFCIEMESTFSTSGKYIYMKLDYSNPVDRDKYASEAVTELLAKGRTKFTVKKWAERVETYVRDYQEQQWT